MTLERWSDYHGAFPGNAERLEIQLYSGDASHLLTEHESDRLDVLTLTDMPIEQHDFARQRLAGEICVDPGPLDLVRSV